MNEKTLADYWLICYRRRASILVMMLAAGLGALWIGASFPAVYEARAMFYVPGSATGLRPGAGDTDLPLPTSNQDDAKANIGILKGRDALYALQTRFSGKSLDAFQRDVDFSAGRDGIIHVYVRDQSPQRAADIANAYLEYFNAFLLAQVQTRVGPRIQALTLRVERSQRELQAALAARHELAATGSDTLDGSAVELAKSREDLNRELDSLRGAIASRSARSSVGDNVRSTSAPVADDLERQVADVEMELAKARTRTLPAHPEQQALLERRAAALRNLQDKVQVLNAHDAARAKTVAEMLRSQDRRLRTIPEKRLRLAELDQQVADQRAALGAFRNQLDDLQLAGARSNQVAISTETARAPLAPVFPIPWLNVLIAVCISLLMGVLYALLLDYVQVHARTTARLRSLARV